jgi:NAD(P)H-dependent flavin oxidoreductase YrpB (nitropropane dioxygenase family)
VVVVVRAGAEVVVVVRSVVLVVGTVIVVKLVAVVGDVNEGMMSVGQGVEVVHEILPAGEIVRRVVGEAKAVLTGVAPDR